MRKGLRRIVFAALAVGLIVALVKVNESREALEARQAAERTRIENLYHRIDDDLNDVDGSLSKLSAASSPRQSVLLLGDVWRATGSAGAAPLANWTLERVGNRWAGAIVSLESDDTGLWIVVKVPSETMIILR